MITSNQNVEFARLVLVVIFLALAIAILVFDVWAWSVYGREASASALIHQWSKEWPLLPLLVGVLISHLFW